MGFFDELARTTRAHCEAHGFQTAKLYGLSDEELNGKPLSEEELDRAVVIDHALADAITQETRWLMLRNPHWSLRKAAQWAHANVLHGVSARPNPRAIVEYARTEERKARDMEMFARSLGEYYADCERRAIKAGTVTWVGD